MVMMLIYLGLIRKRWLLMDIRSVPVQGMLQASIKWSLLYDELLLQKHIPSSENYGKMKYEQESWTLPNWNNYILEYLTLCVTSRQHNEVWWLLTEVQHSLFCLDQIFAHYVTVQSAFLLQICDTRNLIQPHSKHWIKILSIWKMKCIWYKDENGNKSSLSAVRTIHPSKCSIAASLYFYMHLIIPLVNVYLHYPSQNTKKTRREPWSDVLLHFTWNQNGMRTQTLAFFGMWGHWKGNHFSWNTQLR